MTANIEEKIELNEQTPLKSDTDMLANANDIENENAFLKNHKEEKKSFKIFSFGKQVILKFTNFIK